MAAKRVIFIRPGETEWNKQGRRQGHVMIPLNAHGRAQAERLATFLRNLGLNKVYSSDLRRAAEAAEIIASEVNVEVVYDKRLRERNMGEWQGLTREEIIAWYPEQYDALRSDLFNYKIPNGESRKEVYARFRDCFDQVIENDDSEIIAFIAHTIAIKTLLDVLIPENDNDLFHRDFRNMSVTTIQQHEGGEWEITQLDDVTHLEGMDSLSMPEVEKEHNI